jgi:hypothetical protein
VAGYGLIITGSLVISELRKICETSSPSANTRVSRTYRLLPHRRETDKLAQAVGVKARSYLGLSCTLLLP